MNYEEKIDIMYCYLVNEKRMRASNATFHIIQWLDMQRIIDDYVDVNYSKLRAYINDLFFKS